MTSSPSPRVTITFGPNGATIVALVIDGAPPIRLEPDRARELGAELIAVADHIDPRISVTTSKDPQT